MSNARVQWAYGAVHQLGKLHRQQHLLRPAYAAGALAAPSQRLIEPPRPTSVASTAANLLLSSSSQEAGAPRILLLASRREGVAGVEWSDARVPFTAAVQHGIATKGTPKAHLMERYLVKRGFDAVGESMTSSGFARPPLVVHTNHLVAWRLGQRASPLYAHSIRELLRLGRREMATLQPTQSFVCHRYYEWDCIQEVLREPGWEAYVAEENVIAGLVTGTVDLNGILQAAAKA